MKTKKRALALGVLTSLLCLGFSVESLATTYTFKVSSVGVRPAVQPPTGPFNFATCGATGATGPTASACSTAYSGTSLAGQVSVSGGIQSWTVPATGTYTVRLAGAVGGPSSVWGAYSGGSGAVLTTQLSLTQGTVLKILVGQTGTNGSPYCGGGGGGTYVVTGGTALAVAGGGAGAGSSGNGYSASTNLTNTGNFISDGNTGGAGFNTNGPLGNSLTFPNWGGGQAYAFTAGGLGAAGYGPGYSVDTEDGYVEWGGFGGGGGGGWADGGGGGGYTASNPMGGGTTYTSGTAISSTATNTGMGFVTFTKN